MRSRALNLEKLSLGPVTPCSVALVELIRTIERIDDLYRDCRGRYPSDEEDALISKLEDRRAALEAQIKREVSDRLGVDYGILWEAVTG